MPDAGTIRKLVDARMAELAALIAPLRAEYDQLASVAARFDDRAAPARPAPSPTRRARRPRASAPAAPTRGKPGGGTRADQALTLITARPGVTAAELGQAMGISRNYLYRVLPKLEQRGLLEKAGTGYRVPGSPAGG